MNFRRRASAWHDKLTENFIFFYDMSRWDKNDAIPISYSPIDSHVDENSHILSIDVIFFLQKFSY